MCALTRTVLACGHRTVTTHECEEPLFCDNTDTTVEKYDMCNTCFYELFGGDLVTKELTTPSVPAPTALDPTGQEDSATHALHDSNDAQPGLPDSSSTLATATPGTAANVNSTHGQPTTSATDGEGLVGFSNSPSARAPLANDVEHHAPETPNNPAIGTAGIPVTATNVTHVPTGTTSPYSTAIGAYPPSPYAGQQVNADPGSNAPAGMQPNGAVNANSGQQPAARIIYPNANRHGGATTSTGQTAMAPNGSGISGDDRQPPPSYVSPYARPAQPPANAPSSGPEGQVQPAAPPLAPSYVSPYGRPSQPLGNAPSSVPHGQVQAAAPAHAPIQPSTAASPSTPRSSTPHGRPSTLAGTPKKRRRTGPDLRPTGAPPRDPAAPYFAAPAPWPTTQRELGAVVFGGPTWKVDNERWKSTMFHPFNGCPREAINVAQIWPPQTPIDHPRFNSGTVPQMFQFLVEYFGWVEPEPEESAAVAVSSAPVAQVPRSNGRPSTAPRYNFGFVGTPNPAPSGTAVSSPPVRPPILPAPYSNMDIYHGIYDSRPAPGSVVAPAPSSSAVPSATPLQPRPSSIPRPVVSSSGSPASPNPARPSAPSTALPPDPVRAHRARGLRQLLTARPVETPAKHLARRMRLINALQAGERLDRADIQFLAIAILCYDELMETEWERRVDP